MRTQEQTNEAIRVLTARVERITSVSESAVALVTGLRQELNDMVTQNDGLVPVQQIQQLSSALDVSARRLADAISANNDDPSDDNVREPEKGDAGYKDVMDPDDIKTGPGHTTANNISNAPTGVLNPHPLPPGGDKPVERTGMGSAPAPGPDGTTASAPDLQSGGRLVNQPGQPVASHDEAGRKDDRGGDEGGNRLKNTDPI